MTHSAPLPVVEGLFQLADGNARLIGSRCVSCGTVYFPQAVGCRNPHCQDRRVERALIEGQGVLYSYTVQNYRPPPLFGMEPWAPYAIGLVDLSEGLRVMAMLAVPIGEIHIGMPVRLVAQALYSTKGGGRVLTPAFAADFERGGQP